tara:strand:- start:9327 stop:9668 length:342 start_codon:yes stop_codon:yes gene_type:complete
MKLLQLLDEQVVFEQNKIYRIPRLIQRFDSAIHYVFEGPHLPLIINYVYIDTAVPNNCLYATCLGFNPSAYLWEFERYPDKTIVYIDPDNADSAFPFGIFELTEDELIIENIK